MPNGLTAEYWRDRAERLRAIARDVFDQPTRETLLRIAHDYEVLAQRADERERLN